MKHGFLSTLCAVTALLLLGLASSANADVYDVAADWSDISNPNGVWAYGILNSSTYLFTPFDIHTNTYINVGPPLFTGNQPAWTDVQNTGDNGTPEGLAKSLGIAQPGLDFPLGRVGGHTPKSSNYLAIEWTAPQAGTLSITGGLWIWASSYAAGGVTYGRMEEASLYHNGSALFSDVNIPYPPTYTSANTFSLANAITAGGGNTSSLQNISVHEGDTIILAARRENEEWVVGFDETITFTPAAEAITVVLTTGVLQGGVTGAGTVTLTSASANATTVTLASSDPMVASVPASITIPAGATSATFPITSTSVVAYTPVTITATVNGVSNSASLLVSPSGNPTFRLIPTSVIGGIANSKGKITIPGPAPAGGIVVVLSSSDPATASVPSSVTIPTGATSVTFPVTTYAVTTSTLVAITASSNGTSGTEILTVLP